MLVLFNQFPSIEVIVDYVKSVFTVFNDSLGETVVSQASVYQFHLKESANFTDNDLQPENAHILIIYMSDLVQTGETDGCDEVKYVV